MTTADTELRDALVELAIAVDYHTAWEARCPRARDALDRAWQLVDSDGAVRQHAQREAGCVDCGGPFAEVDHPDAELCSSCAATEEP